MSPSTTAFTTLAAWQQKTGMIVRHCEDEIAVVNQALGFSFAGVRTATSTSGGGFSLMVEALSYAGMAELPLVIYLAQRPGPATGLPTWTAQADLLFAVHAGHGEFPKIVLAAGDVHETIELTLKAFDLADIYQTPVLVLSDKYVGESHFSLDSRWVEHVSESYIPDRGKIISHTAQPKYLRYQDEAEGISPFLLPGKQKGQNWQANSYEHLQDSHTTEDAHEVMIQMEKRARKRTTYLKKHFVAPSYFGNPEARTVFVTWGSGKCPVEQAVFELGQEGIQVGHLHFTHLFPLERTTVRKAFEPSKRYILVEGNSEGQLGKLLQMECGIEIQEKILKYDGRPIWSHEIITYLKN